MCISVIKVVSISVVGFEAAYFNSFQLQSAPTELIFSFMFLSPFPRARKHAQFLREESSGR
jgi:hypothetical protein